MRVVGILVGAFLILGFAFIEPAKNMDSPMSVIWILVGIALMVTADVLLIRRVLRREKVVHRHQP